MDPTQEETKQLSCLIPLRLQAMPEEGEEGHTSEMDRREYRITLIQAGRVRRRDGQEANWDIPAGTIQAAIEKMNGRPVFVDHHADFWTNPSVERLAAVTFDVTYNAVTSSADGKMRMYDTPLAHHIQTLLDQLIADAAAGEPVPDVGLSLSFFGRHDWIDIGEEPGEEFLRVTTEITHVESCDIVFGPGAQGRVRDILSAISGTLRPAEHPHLANGGTKMGKFCSDCGGALVNGQEHTCQTQPASLGSVAGATPPAQPPAAAATPPAPGAQQPPAAPSSASPAVVSGPDERVARLEANLDRLTALMAAQAEPGVVQGMGQAPNDRSPRSGATDKMWNSWDQVQLAYEQLMGMPVAQPVHRFSGLKEMYLMLTGDRDMRGRYNRDLAMIQLAYNPAGNNADTTSMAELTRNVMMKKMIEQVNLLQEYMWWRRVASIENFSSLQQVSFVRVGGIGDLPTVVEKAEYTQLAFDDARTTADWVKKGGYLPLSLEMIDRDDLMGWRAVPRQLAWASVVTLSNTCSALYTDNNGEGPSITVEGATGNVFGGVGISNLIHQPLDPTNWGLAVETMYKLAQLNVAGRRQGVRPKFALVPVELEEQGIQAATSPVKPGTFTDKIPTKRILPEENIITVPQWTNATNWAAQADPNMVPFFGVGFRFGETPELFTQADPTSFLLFFNDVLPIKVRYFFAVGIIDPRGAIKSNI